MRRHFPPGAIRCQRKERREASRCAWREDEFLFHVIRGVILPAIPLRQVFENWVRIVEDLMEPHRRRERQLHQIEKLLAALS